MADSSPLNTTTAKPSTSISTSTSTSTCAQKYINAASGSGRIIDDSVNLTTFLSTLTSPLNDFVLKALTLVDDGNNTENKNTNGNKVNTAARVDKFEISTRSHLLKITSSILQSNASHDEVAMERHMEDLLFYLRAVMDVCRRIVYFANLEDTDSNKENGKSEAISYFGMDSVQLRKLPFQLLEDTIDTLPISIVQTFWKFGPSNWLQDILCKPSPTTTGSSSIMTLIEPEVPDLFQQGSKYCLIRLCNRLLKNLSVHSQDEAAQFAGQISMTLASVFPLSERSAVNVLGAFHVDNLIEFEDPAAWLNQSGGNNNGSGSSSASTAGGNQVTLNYEFYSTFWGVQQSFTDPQKLIPKVVGVDQKVTNMTWSQNMTQFLSKVKFVLGAFESHPFAKDLIQHLNQSWRSLKQQPVGNNAESKKNGATEAQSDIVHMEVDTDPKDTNEHDEDPQPELESQEKKSLNHHYKYLTNSQLLSLQIKDPEIRIHFLTQLLIISSYLSSSISNTMKVSPSVSSDHRLSSICDTILRELTQLGNRTVEILKETPPNGETHVKTLQWILSERESIWRQWKKAKCAPPIEKYAKASTDIEQQQQQGDSGSTMKSFFGGGKRKKEEDGSLSGRAKLFSYSIDIENDLPSISSEISQKHNPDLHNFLEDYVDALDPESGIEEEYHPKNNKLFAWRAMRLLSRKYAGDFEGKHMIRPDSGDFEGLVRKIWKEERDIDIPGEMVIDEDNADIKDKEKSAEKTDADENQTETDNDENMKEDDAETGEIDNELFPGSSDDGETKTEDKEDKIEEEEDKTDDKPKIGNEDKDVKGDDEVVNDTKSADKAKDENKSSLASLLPDPDSEDEEGEEGEEVEGADSEKEKVEHGQTDKKRKREDAEDSEQESPMKKEKMEPTTKMPQQSNGNGVANGTSHIKAPEVLAESAPESVKEAESNNQALTAHVENDGKIPTRNTENSSAEKTGDGKESATEEKKEISSEDKAKVLPKEESDEIKEKSPSKIEDDSGKGRGWHGTNANPQSQNQIKNTQLSNPRRNIRSHEGHHSSNYQRQHQHQRMSQHRPGGGNYGANAPHAHGERRTPHPPDRRQAPGRMGDNRQGQGGRGMSHHGQRFRNNGGDGGPRQRSQYRR